MISISRRYQPGQEVSLRRYRAWQSAQNENVSRPALPLSAVVFLFLFVWEAFVFWVFFSLFPPGHNYSFFSTNRGGV